MSYIEDEEDPVEKRVVFVEKVLKSKGLPTLKERLLEVLNVKPGTSPQTLEEAKEEAYRYLVILQDGQPRVGPDTLAEWVQKTFQADAYIEAFQAIIYGRES